MMGRCRFDVWRRDNRGSFNIFERCKAGIERRWPVIDMINKVMRLTLTFGLVEKWEVRGCLLLVDVMAWYVVMGVFLPLATATWRSPTSATVIITSTILFLQLSSTATP